MSIFVLPFILMSAINLPKYLKEKDYAVASLLTLLLVASVLVVYSEVTTLLDSGIPLV